MQQEPFTFKKVTSDDKALLKEIFRLRYQVYALECQFIKPEDYPEGIERDEYDDQSLHFAALNAHGELIGTMRMILSGKLPLPIEEHCPTIQIPKEHPNRYVEISRLVISRQLRRRKNDELYYEPQVEDARMIDKDGVEFFRRAKPMAFGLYREMYRESKRRGINYWYSLMEKSLWLLLRLHGFKFECIGDEVDVYGPVRPYVGEIAKIEEEVQSKFQKFYTYFMEDYEKEVVAEEPSVVQQPVAPQESPAENPINQDRS